MGAFWYEEPLPPHDMDGYAELADKLDIRIATGEGTLTYQWQKNGANLSNGGHYSGVTTATLTISTADTNDAANYRCVVTNAYGSANVTLQTYRQSNPNTPDTGFRNTMAGTVSYRHGSAFGVPRLRYSLLGQVNTLPQETRLTGDVNALRDRVTFSIEQRLDYIRYDFAGNQYTTAVDKACGWHNRLFALMPSALSRLAGAMLYRHMG